MSFFPFSRLPTEIRLDIWGRCNPTTTAHQGCCNPPKTAIFTPKEGCCNPLKTAHLTIREEDYDILSICPPPALYLTNQEAQDVAQSVFGLKPFPVFTVNDWEDLVFSPALTPLEIFVQTAGDKKAGHGLNVTWTELATILGDALFEARRIHVVCGDLTRLERLWIQYREGDVLVGEAVSEAPCFSADALASNREVQLLLHKNLVVTASPSSLAELAGEEVFEWRVERELEGREEVVAVEEEEEVEEEVEKSGNVLTLDLLVEMEDEIEERWTDTAVMQWIDDICVEDD